MAKNRLICAAQQACFLLPAAHRKTYAAGEESARKTREHLHFKMGSSILFSSREAVQALNSLDVNFCTPIILALPLVPVLIPFPISSFTDVIDTRGTLVTTYYA